MRSDWIRWLESQPWYVPDAPRASLYPLAVEYLLRPQSNRKEFFQQILKPDVRPSEGYMQLANLMARRLVRTVLTTNFDDLVVRTARQTPAIKHIEEIFTESDHTMFRTVPAHPQVVYLHGSVSHYTDCNLIKETQELNAKLVALLQPLLRDHPLVVVGYRGTEPSIMKHLLIDQAANCGRFREGIWWCHLQGTSPTQEAPLVAELVATIGSNLQFVSIDDFDQLLISIERSVQASAVDAWGIRPQDEEASAASKVNDLQSSSLGLERLNEPLLRTKLVEYASAMRLPAPDLGTTDKLWAAMIAQSLAVVREGGHCATRGAQLLFAKGAENQTTSAQIRITVAGPRHWVNVILDNGASDHRSDTPETESLVIGGDLWSQLDATSNLLSRVNRPFRLKGTISQTAYPYPPLALKELITNLLAHRDYAVNQPATLTITPAEIRFENPGGLVESVRRQLDHESIQEVIDVGTRPLKGYRNPVVADFFFSAGAMDKEGSGLPDVLQEAANNLNSVEFGPVDENRQFVAVIRCRPEALLIDDETNTARPQHSELRYSPNLLQVTTWPEHVNKLGTVATARELARVENSTSVAFGAHRNWIWTFADLSAELTRPLLELSLEEERHTVPTSELINSRDAGAVLPRLLNAAVSFYLKKLGMRVWLEAGRVRAYYPSTTGDPTEISYKSTFRQSKRTVAKPIVSRTTGKIVYWEHKAVSLRFERFGTTWALALLPGYVFTIDGDTQPIPSERIGPLSTRRAARDYNATVFHDLVFWSRMISRGIEGEFWMPLSEDASPPLLGTQSMVPTFVFQESGDLGVADALEAPLQDGDLESLQEEIEHVVTESVGVSKQDETTDN